MLYFARWKIALIVLVVAAGILTTLPNFFSQKQLESWPDFLPKNQMVLGLDLQGGAYLLYEIDKQDYVQKRMKALVGDIRSTLREDPRIGYTGLGVQGDAAQVRIRDLTGWPMRKSVCNHSSTRWPPVFLAVRRSMSLT